MIANSIILPTEQPVDIHDIKRALLTYDKVFIPSPDDRELIPPNVYQNVVFQSIGFPALPIGGSFGSVKPLGKVDNYEIEFDKTIEECKNAIREGKIEILGAPKYEESMTIGAIPLPEDTPNPLFTYINYRQMAENEEFVKLMSQGFANLNLDKIKDFQKLTPTGQEDQEQSVNDQRRPPKIMLSDSEKNKDKMEIISKMSHTRIGSLSKYLGYSFLKQLHPFTTDIGYANVISKLEYNFIDTIEAIESDELLLKRQKQLALVHNLILNEYINPKMIDKMTVNQILKKRTKAWGKTQEFRNKLISELNEIALDSSTDFQFHKNCKKRFEEYLKVASDYKHEVDKLNLMLLFDANLFFFLRGEAFHLLEKILKAPSFETLLMVGSLGVVYAKQHFGTILDIIKQAEEKREATGYAIYSNYKYLLT